MEETSREGWTPEAGDEISLAQIVDEAFDYRGYTTLVLAGGVERAGYVFNRNGEAAEPFLQIFDERGAGPFTIPYAQIKSIRLSGKDHAAGQSWEAWVMRRDAARAKIRQGAGDSGAGTHLSPPPEEEELKRAP